MTVALERSHVTDLELISRLRIGINIRDFYAPSPSPEKCDETRIFGILQNFVLSGICDCDIDL